MTEAALKLKNWTLDEYHRMIDAGILIDQKVELLKGEIVEMVPEREPHAYRSHTSGKYLTNLLGDRADVREQHPVTLPNGSEPEPDLAIVEPLDRVYLSHHPFPENILWIVECSDSSLSRDTNLKAQIYAEVGIREYWIIDVRANELIVHRDPFELEYRDRKVYKSGTIQSLAFPDIEIDVSRIINA